MEHFSFNRNLVKKELVDKFLKVLKQLKDKPALILVLGVGLLLIIYLFASKQGASSSIEDQQIYGDEKPQISGVEKAVDPRAKWTAEVIQDIKALKSELDTLILKQNHENKQQIEALTPIPLQKLENRYL